VAAAADLPPAFAPAWRETEALFDELLAQHRQVGASMVIVQDGQVVAGVYRGLANIERGWPVDEQTIYHWASNTKTFTGIAIMQLRDRGLLSLDDKITDYIPELRQVHNPFGSMDDITLRHLMTHSAGFQVSTWPWGGDQPWHPHEPLHWEQLVAMFPYMQIDFEPGSRYRYSNPGIIYLGRVIELLTTDDYEVYVDKNILRPLEMHRSYFDVTPYHLARHKAQSYTLVDGQPRPARPETNTGITVANGGLNAPLGDMAKYMGFLMGAPDDPARQAVYDGVLKRESLEEMWVPVHRRDDSSGEFMALTFFVQESGGRKHVRHTGGQNAFVTRFELDPAAHTAALMAFNTLAYTEGGGAPSTGALSTRLRDHVLERLFPILRAGSAGAARP
jgi:CubicO group peptidase (beta-lactamase class C family)